MADRFVQCSNPWISSTSFSCKLNDQEFFVNWALLGKELLRVRYLNYVWIRILFYFRIRANKLNIQFVILLTSKKDPSYYCLKQMYESYSEFFPFDKWLNRRFFHGPDRHKIILHELFWIHLLIYENYMKRLFTMEGLLLTKGDRIVEPSNNNFHLRMRSIERNSYLFEQLIHLL